MALINCPNCGHQISDKAATCVSCGFALASVGKCKECGNFLDLGSKFCPKCGCPVEEPAQKAAEPKPVEAVRPVPPPQPMQPMPPPTYSPNTAYTAPAAAPAPVQLGSAKARVREMINRKTTNTNIWLLIAMAASGVMFMIAFTTYMKVIGIIEDIAAKGGSLLGLSDTVKKVLNTVNGEKSLLIGILILAAILFISDLVRMSRKQLMRSWKLGLPVLAFGILEPLSSLSLKEVRELESALEPISSFTPSLYVFLIAVLFIISLVVISKVPNEQSFCQNCGNSLTNVYIGNACPHCGERRLIFGFSPVERDIVKSYPYSRQTLVGQSPVRIGKILAVAAINIFFIVLIFATVWAAIPAAAVVTVSIIFLVKNGIRDEIKVTPSDVSVRNKGGKEFIPISQIIEVLTNERGDLGICLPGRYYVFTDISNRAQIAAALRSLISNR